MSHPMILPPVHETSPPPLDDDDENEDEIITTIQYDDLASSNSPDVLNNSTEDWKSVDDNNDTDIAQIQDDISAIDDETAVTNINNANEEKNDDTDINHIQDDISAVDYETAVANINNTNEEKNDNGWANFATFENKTDEVSEISPVTTSPIVEEDTGDDWADFESNTTPTTEQPVQSPDEEQVVKEIVENDDDDDFGDFSEVQTAPKPQTSSLPNDVLSTEQIDSLISTCFPMECFPSSPDDIPPELPSFTTSNNQVSYLEPSLSLWNVLSNISNDPIGIKFQWRKSSTERLFHQSLGVNERFRTKNVPLTPEILQPEKVKSTTLESENIENENKSSNQIIRPHFDWKQSGLENPLTDNDSSSLSSNISKNEDHVFDANKTLDLDYYVPPIKSSTEEGQQQIISPPIIQQRQSIPIKTMDLFPGSTTILNDDAKRIIDSLPNFSFMSAKALIFPIRFNGNTNDDSTTFY